jgi:cell division protein FtsW
MATSIVTKPARGHRGDYILALCVFMLMAFGLIMMYNINPALSQKLLGQVDSGYYFRGQLENIVAALFAWAVATNISYQRWRGLALPLLIGALLSVLLLMIPAFSFSKNGATRWLKLGPASFQPAELLKLALIVYLAAWFERRQDELKSFWDGVLPFGIMLFVTSIIVVIFQRDMGTMMVLALAALGMFYVAGIRLQHLLLILSAGIAAGWLAIITFPHRLSRLMVFLDPGKDANGGGYHISQALIAIGSGGIFGLGLGKSIQIYGYLPEASNDSIFAIIGEEFGLLGAVIVIGLFGIIVYRGIEVARKAPDMFGRLVATGITLIIMFQAFINIAAMLSLVPLTGIPLPYISYGGSSLVIMLFATGILFNISKYTVNNEEAYADNRQRRGDGRPHLSSPGSRRRLKTAR